MIQYTREEAIEKVLQMADKLGHIPTKDEYMRDDTVNLEGLEKALDKDSYAGVNIAVLEELRRLEGRSPRILDDINDTSWQSNHFVINLKKFGEAKRQELEAKKVNHKTSETEVKKMGEEIKADIAEIKEATEAAGVIEVAEVENEPPTDERKAKKRDYKFWDEKEVARIIKKFYDIKGRLPSDQEIRVGFLRNVCGEPTPTSPATISKYLGANKTEWLVSIERILSHKTKNGASDGEPIISFEQPLDFLSDKSDNFESDEALEAAILKKKQENMELISEDEYERYQCIDLEQFFKTAEAVRNMVEDGTLKKIQAAANRFNFETRVCAEEAGINLYFIAKIEK